MQKPVSSTNILTLSPTARKAFRIYYFSICENKSVKESIYYDKQISNLSNANSKITISPEYFLQS